MAMAELLLLPTWGVFFVLHSLFASHAFKRYILAKLPRLAPCYRLAYNLVALIMLIPVFWIHAEFDAEPMWQWTGVAEVVTDILLLLALSGFVWSLKYYDMRAFTGIKACRSQDVSITQDSLTISPLHRFVRHPWYLFAIVIIWSRAQNSLTLISSIMITLYFFIGSKLEERKLLRDFGTAYGDYMKRVPGIIPRPWRRLSVAEANRISRRQTRVAAPGRASD